jgi:hypothetical protein
MLQLEVNKTIEKRLEPVFDSQKKLEVTAQMLLIDPVQQLDQRLQVLELAVSGKNSKQDRLNNLES